MPILTRNYSTVFEQGLREDLLKMQLQGAGVPGVQYIARSGDAVDISVANALTQEQEATLDAVCAAHVPIPINPRLYVVVTLAESERVVTEDQNWQTIAGMVGNPSFFASVLANCFGQVLGEVDVVGSGAQIRIVEYNYMMQTSEEKLAPTAIAATSGWALFSQFTTGVGRTGHNRFELQARLNGATSMKFRFLSLGLLEWF